jgi:hypothetical protein
MAIEPGLHLGVLVAAVIVENDVDELAGRISASIVLRKRMNSYAGGAASSGR